MNNQYFAEKARYHDRLPACRILTKGFPPDQREAGAHWLSKRYESGENQSDCLIVGKTARKNVVAAGSIHLDGAGGATITAFSSESQHAGGEDAVIQFMIHHARSNDAKVIQLLAKPERARDYDALLRNGFFKPSPLIEMNIDLPANQYEQNSLPFELIRFDGTNDLDFATLLCDTYSGTLDCPELNDLRSPEETLRSYRNNNRAAEPYWFWAKIGNEPIAVLMLNPNDESRIWELSYLGLVTKHRQKGYGKVLVTVALHTAARDGARGMILTTDARNQPAIRLYQSAGFRECGSYDVFLHTFNS